MLMTLSKVQIVNLTQPLIFEQAFFFATFDSIQTLELVIRATNHVVMYISCITWDNTLMIARTWDFLSPATLGEPCCKKNGKKRWQCHPRGEGGHPQYLFLAQIYQGLKSLGNGLCTLTNWPQNVICVHTCMHCGLICGIWDWQSTIVKDLNDS